MCNLKFALIPQKFALIPQPLLHEGEGEPSQILAPLPFCLSLPTSLKKLGECLTNALDLALAPFSWMPERL